MASSLNSYLYSVFFLEENLPKEREKVPMIKSKEQAEDGKLILLSIK
jgi:hypothetical protein